MAVAMMSHRGSSTQFSSALVLLLTVVVLDRGSTVVKSLREPDDAMSLKRPMTKRRVARMPGDILIGALFPVHRQPSLKTAYTRQCGEVRSSLKIIILFHFNRVFYRTTYWAVSVAKSTNTLSEPQYLLGLSGWRPAEARD